ncbi:LacI family DNA-binding transcriptional regulator [Streptomyces sp. NPDC020983]|uniref:LacI family DNA-binding transcriptional regulator n=1 Tax=Streptomyces sp. NPDC020983 TaxID=3365106 RepID=UPI00378B21D6
MSVPPGRRSVTIQDVARRAEVSRSAVSLSVNGRPGVSAATRARVLAAAAELGWSPNHSARALRGVRDTAVGLVLTRSPRELGHEPFWTHFIAGIGEGLATTGHALELCLATGVRHEMQVYRRWWLQQRVSGAIVVDVRHDDERLPLLRELSLPVVVAGPPHLTGGLPAVWSGDDACMDTLVRHLAALGHRHIAWAADDSLLLGHTTVRTEAFSGICAELGVEAVTVAQGAGGDLARVTRTLLLGAKAPTAVIYESTMAAIAALGVAKELGVHVPDGLSIVAWDDSALCRITRPPLAVARHHLHDYGVRAARSLLRVIGGAGPEPVPPAAATVRPRGSTAVPRRPGPLFRPGTRDGA